MKTQVFYYEYDCFDEVFILLAFCHWYRFVYKCLYIHHLENMKFLEFWDFTFKAYRIPSNYVFFFHENFKKALNFDFLTIYYHLRMAGL